MFFWLFVYTLFLQSRIKEIFDSAKYNSYRIYLFIGYGVPFAVMLTVSGLGFPEAVDFGVSLFVIIVSPLLSPFFYHQGERDQSSPNGGGTTVPPPRSLSCYHILSAQS